MNKNSTGTVLSRFQEMVARFPRRPAIHHKRTLTYQELDFQSARIAECFSRLRPGLGPVVGLSFFDTPKMVTAMLGVMKTGRAYTIIPPDATGKRLQAIMNVLDLAAICGDAPEAPWANFSGCWIDTSAIREGGIGMEVVPRLSPDSPAAIIQTSGTTGEPLGVEISHASFLHTIGNYTNLAGLNSEDRFTLLTSPAHFTANTSIFGALLNGACVLPFDLKTRGFAEMADWLKHDRLSIYQSPPSLFRAFVRSLPETRYFPSLRFLRLGGEPVLTSDYDLFKKHFPPHAQFVQTFGMSEAGGNIATFRFEGDISFPGFSLPVGIPSPGQDISIVDKEGNPVPRGDVGEIVIRSDFLATGYYRRPDLTAQKFSHSHTNGQRELWTGDLGHWTSEGLLVHDGRKDDQVKILCHRVNISQMEALLQSLSIVQEARVLVLQTRAKEDELIAFVVPTDSAITAGEIHSKLRQLVTGDILPRILLLESFPLTPGGKMDRSRLWQLAKTGYSSPVLTPPRNKIESSLLNLWKRELNVSGIGVYDDFFASGGDSLMAMALCVRMQSFFHLKFPIWLFLDRPTIAQVGEYIEAHQNKLQAPGGFRYWSKLLHQKKAERVVLLRRGLNKQAPPLFICPGGWGHERELLVFAAISRALPPDYSVYGLKQNFLGNSAKVSSSINRIAKNFLHEMRKISCTGPYHLLGECIACPIVLEMAHLLKVQGEPPGKLILLDPRRPNGEPPKTGGESATSAEKLRCYYHVLSEAKPRSCAQFAYIIGPGDIGILRNNFLSLIVQGSQYEITQVSGDHSTYIRENKFDTIQEINKVFST